MDAQTIQAKINYGYGAAAQRVGYAFSQYRPADPLNPIEASSLLGTLNAAFTVKATGFSFEKPGAHKDVLWNGLFDATNVQVGDYLTAEGHGTYFVAALQDLLPPLCVECNRTITVTEPGPTESYGINPASTYGGTTESNETAVMTGWPASILFDARGRATEVGLPLDLPSPFFVILLPYASGIDIRTSNAVSDDLGRRYVISASEQTALGWRIFAQQAVT